MPRITHFLLSCPSAAELSSSNPERQTVLRRTPQKLSWRFCGRNHTLTNRHGLAAARVGADKIAIVEAPFDARQNQAYLVDGYGWRYTIGKRSWRILWCMTWRQQTTKLPCLPIVCKTAEIIGLRQTWAITAKRHQCKLCG